jgi:hypothetical protein
MYIHCVYTMYVTHCVKKSTCSTERWMGCNAKYNKGVCVYLGLSKNEIISIIIISINSTNSVSISYPCN